MRVRSWQIIGVFAYGLLVGILVGRFMGPTLFGAIIVLSFCFAFFLRKRRVFVALMWTAVLAVAIGALRSAQFESETAVLQGLAGQEVYARGVIEDDPTIASNGKTRLKLREVYIGQERIEGSLLVYPATVQKLRRSDTIIVRGTFREGFGGFAGSITSAEITNFAATSQFDTGLKFRDWFGGHVRNVLPEPHASLALGYLVGENTDLPEDLSLELRLTGLTHIIVASGFNLTIMVMFARKLFHRVSRYSALIAGLALVIGFIAVSGSSPSMVRAGAVTILSIVAWYYGRRFKPYVLLGIVAVGTALWNPYYAWGDVGWYLSFLAFGGVLIAAPIIERYFFEDMKKSSILRSTLIESVSAIALTLPYSVYIFGRLSTVSLAANVAVVPLIPLVMAGTFLAGVADAYLPFIADIFAVPAKAIIDIQLWFVHVFAIRDPGIEVDSVSLLTILLVYAGLAGILLYMWRRTRERYFEDQDANLPSNSMDYDRPF